MSNRAIWNVRKRHESLTKPQKRKRLKRRARLRNGLQAALDRKATEAAESEGAEATHEE